MRDAASGLRAVIAVHDTTLGPAVGGTRMRLYPSFDDAVTRRAAAGPGDDLQVGAGGDAVRRRQGGDLRRSRPATRAARCWPRTPRRSTASTDASQTGCDMGIDLRDVAVMGRLTKHVSHTPTGSKHDTAALAALGVFAGIGAAAQALGREMKSLHVALQGVRPGRAAARALPGRGRRAPHGQRRRSRPRRARGLRAGRRGRVRRTRSTTSPRTSSPPMPAGGILNDDTIPRLRAAASSAPPTTSSWTRATATRCTRAGSSTARTTS